MKAGNQDSHGQSLSIVGKSYARISRKMPISADPARYGNAVRIPYPRRGAIEEVIWDRELDQIEDFRVAIMWYLDPLPF